MTGNGQALSRDADRRLHEAQRLERDARRERQVGGARDAVRSFAGEHVDAAAMSLIMLKFARPERGSFSRAEVLERMRRVYRESGS
jgi:hypothetical protein